MNSEYEKKFNDAMNACMQDLKTAEKGTAFFTISEENWKALVRVLKSQATLIDTIRFTIKDVATSDVLKWYLEQTMSIHTGNETAWKDELKTQAKSWNEEWRTRAMTYQEELTKQVGKQNEKFASDMEKVKQELQDQMQEKTERLYHRLLFPCLLTTLLASVLTLLQIL